MKQSLARHISPKKVPGDPYKQPVPMPKHPQQHANSIRDRKRISKQIDQGASFMADPQGGNSSDVQ